MRFLEKHLAGDGGIREMIGIALPMVVSHGCDTIMVFTDRLFLSRLGPLHMAAAMGGGLTRFVMISFFLGVISYTTPLVAQHLGAGQRNRCGTAAAQGILITIACYPFVLAMRPVGHAFFEFVGIEPAQEVLQTAYFDILLYGAILGVIAGVSFGFFLRNRERHGSL